MHLKINKKGIHLNKYQKKGSLISVIGRIQTRSYDNNDGKKVYVTEVLAENIEYLESKKSEAPSTNNAIQETTEDPYANFGNQITLEDLDSKSIITDDDLPF